MKKLFSLIIISMLFFSCKKDEEKVLRSLNIAVVQLLVYPVTNNGNTWDDFSSYPDPYFFFSRVNSSGIEFQSIVWNNAPQNQANWSTDLVCFAGQNATFVFLDEDGANDDLMGSAFLDLDELKANGYPNDYILYGSLGIQIKLTINYIFK